MRKYITLFFSVLPFLLACNHGGVPNDVLPPDQMTSLLTDVHLVDGRLSSLQQLPDTLYKYGTARYLAVFSKHHTDSAEFRRSYLYYCANPDELIDINVKVLADLQIKTDSLNKLVAKQRTSVRRATPAAPASTFHPSGGYGAGVQPQIAPATHVVPVKSGRPLGSMHHFQPKTKPGTQPAVQ